MIGARIKKYLDENGIKQTFLAQKIGTYNSTMSDILSGRRSLSATEYYLICKALNVPMEKFVEEDLAEEA